MQAFCGPSVENTEHGYVCRFLNFLICLYNAFLPDLVFLMVFQTFQMSERLYSDYKFNLDKVVHLKVCF